MDIAAGEADAALGFRQHVGHFDHRAASEVADAMHRVEPGEAEHQVAEIIDQRGIGQAQAALEDILANAREKAGQHAAAGKIGHGNTLSVRATVAPAERATRE